MYREKNKKVVVRVHESSFLSKLGVLSVAIDFNFRPKSGVLRDVDQLPFSEQEI
jgi:hypothetical protein